MRAQYYISFNNVDWSEFWPTNSPVIKYEREGIEVFKRTRVDKFIIGRTKNIAVFNSLYSRFYDTAYFGVDIYYKITILGVDKFFFIRAINFSKLNDQNNVFEINPEPDDAYRDILAQYERKWKTWSETAVFALDSYVWYSKKRLPAVAFTNISFTTWAETTPGIVTSCVNGGGTQTARYAIPVNTYSGDLIYFTISNFILDPANDPTVQLVNAGGTARSAAVSVYGEGMFTLTQNADDTVFVEFKYIGAASSSFHYQVFYPALIMSGSTLYNVLDKCLNGTGLYPFMGLSYDIVSTYIWNDALPTGHAVDTPNISTYITANPSNDYVIEGAAQWNDLWLARSDIFSTNKEQTIEISFKELMDIIKVKLRAFWFIDADGKFRIEHEKYFLDFIPQADLTSAAYIDDKPETDVKIYNNVDAELFNQVNYKENNERTIGFISYPITYDPKQTSIKVNDISVNITCDIENANDHPDDMAAGLMLLRCIPMGAKTFVPINDLTLASGYGECHPNSHLAWDYLCKYYFTYFSDAKTGYINYGLTITTFDSVKLFLEQSNIRFRMTSDLDWRKPFTLINGKGWLKSAEYFPETGFYSINVCYDPYA